MEILEDELYDEDNPLTIKSICDRILVDFDPMGKEYTPRTSRAYEKPLTKNPNTTVHARLAVNKGTSQRTSGIDKVRTYQNFITVKNPEISRNNTTR